MWPLNQAFRRVCKAVIAVGAVNFTVFWIAGVALGGDAFSGGHQGSHYYLSNHGRRTEVSESVWHYSRIHAASTWITHPLMLACMGLLAADAQRSQPAT